MAIDLPSLIFDVRNSLSDIPVDFATDGQVYTDIRRAYAFIKKIAPDETEDDFFKWSVVSLSTYYTYLNWTSMAEKQLGALPPTAAVRLTALRGVALGFLQLISIYPLTPELTVDKSAMSGQGLGISLVTSVLEDDT